MFKSAIILIRPQQWLKNLFVLAPAFFAGIFFEIEVFKDSKVFKDLDPAHIRSSKSNDYNMI